MTDAWDPDVYERFKAERDRPVHDLLQLLRPAPGGVAADLGCGTGEHTHRLHRHLGAARTIGVDTSPAMLARAERGTGVEFTLGDLTRLDGSYDVVFANASLQWVPGHDELLPRLVSLLRPGGQLAFQVPANFGHPSHVVADELGEELGLPPLRRDMWVLPPEAYAEVLHGCGLEDLEVVLRVYGNAMSRTSDVVEWVSGTLLTRFQRALEPDAYERFLAEYRRRLLDRLGDPAGDAPYFYAFPRILCVGRLPQRDA